MGRSIFFPELRERIVELVASGRPIAQLAHEYEPTEQTFNQTLKLLSVNRIGYRTKFNLQSNN